MRQRTLMLLDKGWDMDDIAETLGVSTKSITRWEDKYEEFGLVDPPSVLRGRPRILNTLGLYPAQRRQTRRRYASV